MPKPLLSLVSASFALAALANSPASAQIPVLGLAQAVYESTLDNFYKDPLHCANMAAVVEEQDPRETARFERDIAAAAKAARLLYEITYDQALFKIKAGCDAQLMTAAGVAPAKVKTKR